MEDRHRLFAPYRSLGLVIDKNPFQFYIKKNPKKPGDTQLYIAATQGNNYVLYEVYLVISPEFLRHIRI